MLVGGIDQSIRIEVFGELHEFGTLGKTVTLTELKPLLMKNVSNQAEKVNMKHLGALLVVLSSLSQIQLFGQTVELKKEMLESVGVTMSLGKFKGRNTVQVVKDTVVKEFDEPTFVKIKDQIFKDGTIEVTVYSKLLPNAPDFSRGFIGVAFRINDNNSRFECIYIRPANGRADDQVRRNHSIQYFAYPDYKFQRLRKESPEKYESYSDMGLNEWIRMKIVVKGSQAKLYLNNNKEPSLIVNDLKLGADQAGGIGLFVDVGTEGHFADLRISR